jgi:hypothetical protein
MTKSRNVMLGQRIGTDNVGTGGRKRVTGDLIGTIERETGIIKATVTGRIVTLGDRIGTDEARAEV